jgi:hypothetical protein
MPTLFLTKVPKTYDGGKNQTLQQIVLRKVAICLQKTEEGKGGDGDRGEKGPKQCMHI